MAKDKEDEAQPTLTEEGEEATPTSRRPLDPEVRVLGQIMRTLDELEEPARVRIVAFISSRYKG